MKYINDDIKQFSDNMYIKEVILGKLINDIIDESINNQIDK